MSVNDKDLYRNMPAQQQPSMFVQQQQQNDGGSIFNKEFTNELDNYLDSASNPMANVEDLKNLNIEELLQNTIDFGGIQINAES